MSDIEEWRYTFADGSIEPSRLPPRMQVWWGEHDGVALGLMTDSTSGSPPGADPMVIERLSRAAAVVKCLADSRLWGRPDASMPDLQTISNDLVGAHWRDDSVVLDGQPVFASTIDCLGLEFLVGGATSTTPFVMARPEGARGGSWPALATVSGERQD